MRTVSCRESKLPPTWLLLTLRGWAVISGRRGYVSGADAVSGARLSTHHEALTPTTLRLLDDYLSGRDLAALVCRLAHQTATAPWRAA